MKVILTEEQLSKIFEVARALPKSIKNKIDNQMTDIAKDYYGDEYNQPNDSLNAQYQLSKKNNGRDTRIINNGIFSSGPFAMGNGKLSPDTLIINFTSALRCPSAASCPLSQLVCYAVAGEVRLDDTRKKNLAVHDLWNKSYQKGDLQRMFDVAETYIASTYEKTTKGKDRYKNKVKFIRYNEAGDFPNMAFLQQAAAFSKKMKDEYGVLSMAYTARVGLDFSTPLKGTDIPIDHIIKINASRVDVKRSTDTVNQNFFALTMGFKEEITNNEKAEYITFKDLDNLKYIPPTDEGTTNGIKAAPYLQQGKWTGGEGLYYICPCSFSIRDKARINAKHFLMAGLIPEYGVVDNPTEVMVNQVTETLNDGICNSLVKKLTPEQRKTRDAEIKTVKSPCGTLCAVCHDMEGGILPNGERVLNYNVLTATHGALASNFDEKYTNAKRMGDDSVRYKEGDERFADNKYGYNRKYRTDAPIRPELFKEPSDMGQVDENKEITDMKNKFWEMLNKLNNV